MKVMTRCFAFLAILVPLFPALSAGQLRTPAHWKWITDGPAKLVTGDDVPAGSWRFVAMPPGWHVTMGPGGILYDPAHRGEGRFTIEARPILFPDPSEEGYGLFLGGEGLEGPERRYVAFLIRRDQSASVVRVEGAEKTVLVPWKKHGAIQPLDENGFSRNNLRVSAEPSRVVFMVNGDTVSVIPREGNRIDGFFGFRIGPKLNLHITYLDFTRHLAPVRREEGEEDEGGSRGAAGPERPGPGAGSSRALPRRRRNRYLEDLWVRGSGVEGSVGDESGEDRSGPGARRGVPRASRPSERRAGGEPRAAARRRPLRRVPPGGRGPVAQVVRAHA